MSATTGGVWVRTVARSGKCSIDALDDFTVRFRFARPCAPLLKQRNVTEAPIIPAHRYVGLPPSSYDAHGNPTLAALNVNSVGTGPMEEVARELPYVWLIETPHVRGYRVSCANFQAHTGLFAEAAYCTG